MYHQLNSWLIAALGLGADVFTISSGTVGNAGNVAAELSTYISAKTLDVAVLNTILDQPGEKEAMPDRNSKTIRFTRFEKFSVSASPTQLTEGTTPDSTGMTVNQFEATMEQYGFAVIITDIAELTAKHPVVQQAINRIGLHAAETYDQLIFNVLDAATNNYRPNSKASDAALVASDKPSFVDLVALQALMQDNGGRPADGQLYTFVTPPQVHGAMQTDPDYKASVQYGAPDRLWRGEMSQLGGFRILVSNAPGFSPTTTTAAGSADKVYSSFAISRQSYKITDLQTLQVFAAAPGGQSDLLQQRHKVGYKFMFKALITNQNWIRRVRSAGLNSVTN